MGNPRTITWYYNETATEAYTSQAGTLTNALTLRTGAGTLNKDGEYYAMIVNEDGQTFISNTITLVYDELPAEIASMNIEDDYDGEGHISYDAKDALAVITVNMKKFYEGKFYVYEDSIVNYNNGNYATMINTADVNFVLASTSEKMTAKNVLDNTFKGTDTSGNEVPNLSNALEYIAPNGETTLMWAVRATDGDGNNFLTRGKSFKVAFDQKEIATDNITAASRKDVGVTESVEAPYVIAPAAIVLETAANGQRAVVNFVDEDGDKLAWLGGDNTANPEWDTACGFESVTVFGNSEAKTDGAERAAIYGTIVKGVWTSTAGLNKDKTIYYAQAKTEAGVFAEKSETLQSDYKTKNLKIAEKVKLAASGTTAKITLSDVVAPAKVYVYNAPDARTAGGFDPDDSSSYRGYAEVSVGQGSAEISSVFKKDEIGEHFFAVLVPNDEAAYARKESTPNPDNGDTRDDQHMILKEDATSIEYLSGTTSTKLDDKSVANYDTTGEKEVRFTNQFISENLIVKNQFGEVVGLTTGTASAPDYTYLNKITDKAATVTVSNGGKKYAEKGAANFTYDGTALTIDLKSFSGVDPGDGFDVTLLGSTINFRAEFEPTNINQKPFTAKLGSDTLCKGSIAVAGGAANVDNASQAATALGQNNVTEVTVAAGGLDGAVTVPENKKLIISGANTGSVTNNGTVQLAGVTSVKGYTAPAKSTSAVAGANALTITDSLTIGAGAAMTVANALVLAPAATVSSDGTLAVTGTLTTNTKAQNVALATVVNITTASGTKDAPTALTAAAPKTTFASSSCTSVSSPGPKRRASCTVAGDSHVQLVSSDTAAYTMKYAYSAKGDNTDTVFFNITY